MDRKEFLKSLGLITAGGAILGTEDRLKAAGKVMGVDMDMELGAGTDPEIDFPVKALKAKLRGRACKGRHHRCRKSWQGIFGLCAEIS